MLPSAEVPIDAGERVLDWCQSTYTDADNEIGERSIDEAVAARPALMSNTGPPDPKDIFDGLMFQRTVLKRDQQLSEWDCCRQPIDRGGRARPVEPKAAANWPAGGGGVPVNPFPGRERRPEGRQSFLSPGFFCLS